MHCSNCSQTLLQRFDDTVITFILPVMKVTQYHRNVAIKFVNNLSSACPNIELGFCVLQTKEQEQGRPGNEATLCAVW